MKYRLLDHLAQHLNADYVSQMKDREMLRPYQEYIRKIPDTMFSLEDWIDTCSYLCGVHETIESVEEAKQLIFDWLNR